jgi:hypothetical protein
MTRTGPYTLSIEASDGKSHRRGVRLGTLDVEEAKQIAEEKFHSRNANGMPTHTIAIMDGDDMVIDCFDGKHWLLDEAFLEAERREMQSPADPDLVVAVRAMHNKLYPAEMYRRYRDLLNATPETNIEGDVYCDEFCAVKIMHEVAIVECNVVMAKVKLAEIRKALREVLLADGLNGSIEAAKRLIAHADEGIEEQEREARESRLNFRHHNLELFAPKNPSKMN